MSIPTLEACKKRKRSYGFSSFCDPGSPISPKGPFRDNIRLFLQECAELEDYSVQGMPTWCTLLVHDNRSRVPLYTIEEDVGTSERPFCDHCRCAGWSNHFVSKRKYHMIITMDDGWDKPLDGGILDLPTHLLHGLIHCNGIAHLVCINGLEGGSKHLYGREIMDLWDRICTNLRTREITVEDVSKKRSMDVRLLYGIAYGHSWFGRWGYRSSHGSFGVSEHNYERALEFLSSLELERIIQAFSDLDQRKELKQIICYYRKLSATQLITIKDLLLFMLTLTVVPAQKKSSMVTSAFSSSTAKPATRAALQIKPLMVEKSVSYRKFTTVIADTESRWPLRRLEFAADVIVNALQEKKERDFSRGGMTRQDVRDAARLHIGDTGLLDHVLKSLKNVIVGNHVVCCAVNRATRILEYTVHDVTDGVKVSQPENEILPQSLPSAALDPGVDVYNDVLYLYEHVLLGYPESELVEVYTRAILDTKHFVKECSFRDEEEQWLTFICQLLPSSTDMNNEFKGELPPGETVVMPPKKTRFDCSGGEVGVRGTGIDLDSPLRYEGGLDTGKVRCECGAREDDGERMVACNICEVWQHTRCCGIEDADTVPPLFVCSACCVSEVPPKKTRFDCSDALLYFSSAHTE